MSVFAGLVALQKPGSLQPLVLRRSPSGNGCSSCTQDDELDDKKGKLQRKAIGEASMTPSVPPIVHDVLRSPGQPLDAATRAFFEPRFGMDFSQVRVYTDAKAAETARSVNALAYTVGQSIVFGEGQYEPRSVAGQWLLAHELTHTVQQNYSKPILQEQLVIGAVNDTSEREASWTATKVMQGGTVKENIRSTRAEDGILRRAETDTSAGCSDLDDTKKDVNDRINQALINTRKSAGGNAGSIIQGLYDELAENKSLGRTGIEVWAQSLGDKKVRQLAQSQTKYAGVTYGLWMQPFFPILNPTMRINNFCVGSDKLGHFLQQGHDYYVIAHRYGGSAAEAEKFGKGTEAGGFGLSSTGVYSNADLEANKQGLRFYEDLAASPSLTFDISNYINERWNEETNPSHYEASVGQMVWRNLLSGSWKGSLGAGSASQAAISNLTVGDDKVSISGQFGYKAPDGKIINGTILNGRITHQANSLKAITGVRIDFDWQSETGAGKGQWTSKNEGELQGTWGSGSSNNNGGSWALTKSRTPLTIPASSTELNKRCMQDCEDDFDRCLKTSTTGGAFCLAHRSACMMNCSGRGQR